MNQAKYLENAYAVAEVVFYTLNCFGKEEAFL